MSKTNFLRMAKNIPLWMLLIVFISCERDISELEPASFSTNPRVFIDGFSGGLEYAAFGGSVPTAFQVDNQVTHTNTSTASMRFEVPDAGDSRGAYAGGAFFTTVGRDLSGYDALTFWAKASKAANIDVVGFGNDLGESKYQASVTNLPVNTNWQKYIIPLPDPSKLKQEKGMFYYSEGPEEGLGYTFWIDELKFEKLGTIAQPQSAILGGANQVETSFIGVSKTLDGLQSIYNLPTGVNQAVNVSPAYFEFTSSNSSIATVDETGRVIVTGGPGNAVITANLGSIQANGSLTIQSGGEYVAAPTPTQDPENVISLFSEAYNNIQVDYYNGFWEPFQTTGSSDFIVNGDRVLNYTNFNFVGIQFTNPTIDATEMTHLHVDIFLPNALSGNAQFNVELNDLVNGTGGSLSTTIRPDQAQQWISLDLPLSGFTGLNPRNTLAQVVFVDGSENIPGFYADNIYLYKAVAPPFELDEAAPTPTRDAADVISMFSDAYTNVPVDTWRTDWSSAVLEDLEIQGNATKKYSELDFVGIETVNNQIDLSEMTHMHIDFFSQEVTQFGIKLVDFGPDGAFGGGDDAEHQVNFEAPNQNEWVSLDIPLSQFAGLVTKGNIAQLILVAQPTSATTLYVDNIYFYNDGQGGGGGQNAEPAVAAPTPTREAAAVISMFSDAYTNVPVDTWRTDWSSAALQDIQIAGNATKKYVALDFVGVETVNNQIDISGMTHMHMNVWSEDFTFFAIKLVDFGPNGAFGGGDDTEHQINIESPGQSQWLSLEIPLSDFTGLTTRGNLAQMILVGRPTGATTVFVDNVYFYDNDYQAGELNAPATAAPTPTQEADAVVSLFSDAYTNATVDTWRTDWSSAVLEDIQVQGNATKKYSSLDFVGVETVSNQVDISGMTHMRMDVWSPDFTLFAVKLVDFGADGAFGGGDDTEHQVNVETPAQREWVSLDIPLSQFAGLTSRSNLAQMILVGQPTGATTVFVDNVYFYDADYQAGELNAPATAAPTPTQEADAVVSLFSDAYTNATVDTWRTDWSSAVLEDIQVQGNATKKYSSLDFVGVETVSNQVDISGMTHMRMDVWSPDFTLFAVKLVDFGADGAFGGGDDTEHQVNVETPAQREWVSLDIPLSQFAGLTSRSNLAQMILVGQPTGATTVFVDNVYFYDADYQAGELNAPATAAPTPTQEADAVVSLFSDAYTNATVDTWRTDWSSAVLEDIQVQGNATKKYSSLDFVGVETVSNQVDISGMTHMRMDVWSPDFTLFAVKLVDFGADGAFGGGDDTEHQVNVETPAQREWVSLDIPLSQFAGLTSRSNLAQMILVGQPTGATTVFVDNVYFYDADYQAGELNAPATAAPTPTQEADAVVSLFSDAYTNATVDTWRTDWSSAVLEDIQVQGNATKKYSSLDFVGVETVSNQVDISGMTHMRMDVWSPDFTLFAVKLVDFGADGAFGGGDDTEHQVNVEMPAQREWVSLDIPMGQFAGLTSRSNLAQMILVGQPTGATTVFVDNVYFYDADYQAGELNAPATAAPTPTQEPASVLSLFSDAYTNVNVDTWRTDWSSAVLEDIQIQGNATKKYSALDFVGIETVGNQVDISGLTHMRMDVWSSDFTFFGVKLVDFGPDGGFGGGDDTEHQINIESPAQRGWVSLDIPLSEFSGLTTRKNIAQIILVGQPTGATTVFVDNVYFYDANFQGGGGGTDELSAPAPTPTLNAEDVISVFSDAYTNVPVDTWRTGWSSATLEDITIQGNATKKYSTLDFVGIETVSTQINASEMTHIRMDVYSRDFTFFGIKLVDFGANGAFGGGDDTEHQVNIETPAQNQWVTIDLPLSRFSGMTSRSNIAQTILVGQPTGTTTVYVDNILYYKAEDIGGGDTGTAIFSQTFDNSASVSNWEGIADANSNDATIQWIAGGGVEGGALQLTAANPSDAAGKAYIFQVLNTGLNFGGKTKVRLTFDIKLGAPLVAAAVHLQTIFPGIGVTNNFDLQGQGLNQNNWTTLSFEFDGLDAAANNFFMHFNLASGAVTNAGGVLLIDNIRLSGLD